MRRFLQWTVIAAAVVLGVGSLALFAASLGILALRVTVPTGHPLWWDTALSFLFFAQHSGMVRRGFRNRLSAFVPSRYHGALYAISSGIVLIAVALLWQRTRPPLLVLTGVALWAIYLMPAVVLAVFLWTFAATAGSLDVLGIGPIRRDMRGRPERSPRFVASGPYKFARHPLYACAILLLWSTPQLTADRLLLNILWTAWIVGATFLEERDLVSDFGDVYRNYRRRVPMLIPWRGKVRTEETV